MCGILTYVGKRSPLDPKLTRNLNKLVHRGPNDQGIVSYNYAILGQTRLSIIDIENGKQPMQSIDSRFCITFNGEIYNYKELRKQLQLKGYEFKTNSDTEVVLIGYIAFGLEILKMLRGMFAFTIWDNEKEELIVARDEFGIKPCYYGLNDDYLSVASELHVLNTSGEKINKDTLPYYLQTGFIPAPLTIYQGLFKLKPGHFFIFSKKTPFIEQKSFTPNDRFNRLNNLSKTSNQVWNDILETVESHLVSDVKFGAFLSGGVDSTLICLAMKEIMGNNFQTFSIGFEDSQFDESKYIQQVAKTLNISNEIEFIKNDTIDLDLVEEIIHNFGEPFGDSSIIPTYHVSKLAAKHVKMVLSGDGGDELFLGYPYYFNWIDNSPSNYLKNKLLKNEYTSFIRGVLGYTKQFFQLKSQKELADWLSKFSAIEQVQLSNLINFDPKKTQTDFEEAFSNYRHLNRLDFAISMDIKTNLPGHLLPKVDITSMMNSLEVRTPFIDQKFYSSVKNLKARLLHDEKQPIPGKKILRDILAKSFDQEFLYRKKQGFSIPKAKLFYKGEPGSERIIDFSKTEICSDLFNFKEISNIIQSHQNQKVDRSEFLWNLLTFSIWAKKNYVP